MIAWITAALAAPVAEPVRVVDTGRSVTGLTFVRPFELATPAEWTVTAHPEPVTRGILLELRADPTLLRARDVGASVLYVGERPAFPFNWDAVGGCLVAWVPGDPDLASTEVFFGSTELPERVDAARGAAERAAARAVGVVPFPVEVVAKARAAGGPMLRARDVAEVEALAMARVEACTQSPEDHLRVDPSRAKEE